MRIDADSGSLKDWATSRMVAASREDGAGPLDDLLAGAGEQHLAGVALDQLDAELGLELLELGRQGRLADVAGLGGPAEVAVLVDGDEVLQVPEVHGPPSRP